MNPCAFVFSHFANRLVLRMTCQASLGFDIYRFSNLLRMVGEFYKSVVVIDSNV